MNLLIITQKVDRNDQLLGFFTEWLLRFAKTFDHILVICLEKGEFNLPENVEVISLGKDRNRSKLIWLFNFYKYIFRSRKQYDAVLVHMNPIWAVLGGWCWRLMKKFLYIWYTSGGVTTKLKLAEKFSHTIFTASKESFRLSSKKVMVTGHGIDTNLFRPDPNYKRPTTNHPLRLLSVGRIAPVKNHEILVEAAKILQKEGMDFFITMVGEAVLSRDKKYEQNLKQKIASLNLQKYFNFVGKINNQTLVLVYQSHDVFVHLSKTGSVDKSLLEALACGMYVLSANESSLGFLPAELTFKANDAAALAAKIKKVFTWEPQDQWRQYVVKNHNLDNLVAKISNVIKN